MASEAGGDARGIGARLRGAREKRGLTILQAAEKLHVDARMLEALEAGNFAALGALVYVRGHLRRYAELLGEPPPEPAEQYAAAPALTSRAFRTASPAAIHRWCCRRSSCWACLRRSDSCGGW